MMSIRTRTLSMTLCFASTLCLCACSGPLVHTRAPDPRQENAWFAAGRLRVAQAAPFVAKERPARNVILFVGDGMGIATVTAARILEGQNRGEPGEENRLSFEDLPHVAFSKTYNTDAQVSDSASTMTAIVTGVKTVTGVLGVDESVRRGDHTSVGAARVLTILEEAEDRGLATGVVSTATVTHATPAGCYSHVPFRFWENDARMSPEAREAAFPDIARQLVEFDHGDGLEVALGGGRSHFKPGGTPDPEDPQRPGGRLDGRDLTQEWIEAREGSVYVWNHEQFGNVDVSTTRHLLGLFEPGDMNWETDRAGDEAGEPSLAEMTGLAIEILSKDQDGFFLMVEAGRIDHGHHAGNAQRALTDTIALSDAVRVALEKTDASETLIVVTADHSHTLTISGYPKRGNPILGRVVGINWFGDGEDQIGLDALKKPYTTLSYANGPGYSGASDDQPEGAHSWGHRPCSRRPPFECSFRGIENGRPDLSDIDTESPAFMQESSVPMGQETHAGEDVPIYAGGARAALFHGVREQNYIYHAMVEAFGWTSAGSPTH
ncbi:MAG: alkaline phosphatase [Deltaproteobacteria bacterium]|nr:alkaline phosphatase [Deltaproteobacteria bacterium]